MHWAVIEFLGDYTEGNNFKKKLVIGKSLSGRIVQDGIQDRLPWIEFLSSSGQGNGGSGSSEFGRMFEGNKNGVTELKKCFETRTKDGKWKGSDSVKRLIAVGKEQGAGTEVTECIEGINKIVNGIDESGKKEDTE